MSDLLNSATNAGEDHLDFKFKLSCKELNEDFSIRVQIFALELCKEKAKKEKSFRMKFGTSSLKRVAKSPMTGTASPIPVINTQRTTSFKPVGHFILNLPNVCKPPSLYRMESYSMSSPIDGYMTMKLSLQVSHNFSAEGFFDLQDPETSFWNVRWFSIKGSTLRYWRFPKEAEDQRPPIGVINLKHCINPTVELLKTDQRQLCMRPFTFILVAIKPPEVSNAHKLVNGGTIVKAVPKT